MLTIFIAKLKQYSNLKSWLLCVNFISNLNQDIKTINA